ncbi:MAG: zinc metallopeptidase [Alphaproteobacteria bacterium]|nr:zinc metallopeptidase [Alphaproteobacteria bacterium SS10]
MAAVIVISLILLVIIVGPGFWASRVIKRNGAERLDFPGSGGEFARHLIDIAGLEDVGVEVTNQGDHYDPEKRMVRLTADHMHGKSLAAVTIAAHEVGHALQHRDGYWAFNIRQPLVRISNLAVQISMIVWSISLIAGPLLKAPGLPIGMGLMFLAAVALSAATRLITLPVEFDASFGRALPILDRGQFLGEADMPQARELLTAAAMTYVSNSLMGMLLLLRQLLPFLRF